jgi:hypothetical protein
LSVGWGDRYGASTNLQWIDITGLPNGKYTLTATADPGDFLQESNYSNNSVSAVLNITTTGVRIVSATPGP